MASLTNGERKRRLHAKDPHCCWCQRVTRIWVSVEGERTPDDAATIDHILPRPERGYGKGCEMYLSCHRCNARRDREYAAAHPEKVKRHGFLRGALLAARKLMWARGMVLDVPAMVYEAEVMYDT